MTESSKSAPAAETAKEARGSRLSRDISQVDGLLAGIAVLLALLLASFVERNSEYWLHLATGRLLAEGKYTFGTDPFAYTTADVYWVNPSWLFDWLLHGLTMLTGGPEGAGGVVTGVLKAMAMAFLTMLLLALRRRDQGWYVPAVCVGLAVLVMAPRMTLGPFAASLLFLGLTLYFLAREGKPDPANRTGLRLLFTTSPRRLYVLPVLFALWANLDGWFILGPVMVALCLLGNKLQTALAPESGPEAALPGEQRTLGVVLAVGLAACLLNPHHVHVFTTLPVELFPAHRLGALAHDPRFAVLFVSPFSFDPAHSYFSPNYGRSICGLAYYPLLLGGVVSFWQTRTHWRVWRVLIWTAFAVLSVLNMLLVPLFAVVAGPIMALNFQDALAQREGKPSLRALRLTLASRLLTLLLAVILLAATWPGWLHAHPGNPTLGRRLGWGVAVDPALKQAAYKLEYWRLQGWLKPGEHGFNFLPETANVFAWFCPEEKGFFDGRHALFADVAPAYTEVRQMLAGVKRPTPGTVPDWVPTFRRHGITHIIVTMPPMAGPRWERMANILVPLWRDPDQWPLLYLDGRTCILGWNDPEQPGDRFAHLRLDLGTAAFGPEAAEAPRQGPGRLPHDRTWLDDFLAAPPLPALETDTAGMYLAYFDSNPVNRPFSTNAAAGILGATNPHGGGLLSCAAMAGYGYLAVAVRDRGPPEALLLSLRAARRAAADNPDDPDTYMAMASTTGKLWTVQENHWAHSAIPRGLVPREFMALLREKKQVEPYLSPWLTRSLSFRHVLRRVQELTALHQYLAARPPWQMVHHYRVHQRLFAIYWSMSYYDVAVEHLCQDVNGLRQAAQQHPADKRLQDEVRKGESLLADCEKQLAELQRFYEQVAPGKPPKVQAQGAFRPFGLPKQALAALMREDLQTLNSEEANLVMYLHLTLGQAEELRGQFSEQQQIALGPVNYELYQVLQAAAVGDYADADAHLAAALQAISKPAWPPLGHMLQGATFGQLERHPLHQLCLFPLMRNQVMTAHQALLSRQRLDDLLVVRGLLALDVGDTAAAVKHFRQAVAAPEPRYDFESRGIATRYLALIADAQRRR